MRGLIGAQAPVLPPSQEHARREAIYVAVHQDNMCRAFEAKQIFLSSLMVNSDGNIVGNKAMDEQESNYFEFLGALVPYMDIKNPHAGKDKKPKNDRDDLIEEAKRYFQALNQPETKKQE